jgi:Fe-S-cluster containining protein
MSSEYQALRAKVDAFAQATAERRQADMACRAGCESCCHTWLTVSPVEAAEIREAIARLSPERRAQLAERGRRELAREAGRSAASEPRCAMLESSGECCVYEQRPLVCRTQGHALRYPPGFVPEAAVRARTRGGASAAAGEITYCPLNYTAAPPLAADVLDAERVDQLLAVVNHRFANARDVPGEIRVAISELAQEADMLGCR